MRRYFVTILFRWFPSWKWPFQATRDFPRSYWYFRIDNDVSELIMMFSWWIYISNLIIVFPNWIRLLVLFPSSILPHQWQSPISVQVSPFQLIPRIISPSSHLCKISLYSSFLLKSGIIVSFECLVIKYDFLNS